MSLKEIFYGIQDFTEQVLFTPFNALRSLELESWWSANIMSWLFTIIGFVAFTYWMLQLKKFNDNNEENRSQVSHSFLGED
ncbi:MAG: uracil phosphoribosyltransferase [Bacteroidetes bacterium]|nr:uracil phosphoribosyltransferase [Bacteroidota bacterium]